MLGEVNMSSKATNETIANNIIHDKIVEKEKGSFCPLCSAKMIEVPEEK